MTREAIWKLILTSLTSLLPTNLYSFIGEVLSQERSAVHLEEAVDDLGHVAVVHKDESTH